MGWILEKILFAFLFIVIGFIAFILVDACCGHFAYYNGVVIDKHYEAEHNSTGIGNTVGANGQVGIVTTIENDPEKFLLIVKKENGKIVTTDAAPELYYKKQIGHLVYCRSFLGKWSGIEWGNETVK